MKVERLKVDPVKARELWRTYREHLAYMTKADEQIAAIYKRLAQGRTVIRAIESIRAAGLGDHCEDMRFAAAEALHAGRFPDDPPGTY